MVVLTASKYVTRWIGPPLMRLGLDLKGSLTRMKMKVESSSSSLWTSPSWSSTLVDWICLLPYSQRLLSVRLYDDLKVLEINNNDGSDTPVRDDRIDQLRDERIELFERTFRPVFLPTETWGDVRSLLTSNESSSKLAASASNSPASSSSFSSYHNLYRGWGDDVRLIAWLRREILTVYYGAQLRQALVSYPTLRQSPQLVPRRSSVLSSSLFSLFSLSLGENNSNNNDNIHHDNRSLPSSQTVVKAFGLRDTNRNSNKKLDRTRITTTKTPHQQKDTQAVRRTMIHTAEKLGGMVLSQPSSHTTITPQAARGGGGDDDPFYFNHVIIPDEDASTKEIPFADIVNLVSGGHTSVNDPETLGPLNLLCEEANVYQWWTQEYVTHLGDYLWARACSSSSKSNFSSNDTGNTHKKKKTLIVDVGAGDGLLIKHLTEYIQHKIGLKEAAATADSVAQTSVSSSLSLRRKKAKKYKKTSTYQQQGQRRRGLSLDHSEGLSKVRDDYCGGAATAAYESNDGENEEEYGQSSSNDSDIPIVELVATDDMSWGIATADTAHVEKLTVEQAIEKYIVPYKTLSEAAESEDDNVDDVQVIVLCSWMPMGLDWSDLFRKANVDEYILIGECDDGSCGHNWFTWGNVDFYDDTNEKQGSSASVPPYQKDGYERWDMDDALTPFQFSRYDCSVSKSGKTVSFRRRKL